jgi:hypothetical protein
MGHKAGREKLAELSPRLWRDDRYPATGAAQQLGLAGSHGPLTNDETSAALQTHHDGEHAHSESPQ